MIAVVLPSLVALIVLAGVLTAIVLVAYADRAAADAAELADIDAWLEQIRDPR